MTLSITALRKLPTGSTVRLASAPYVRFTKGEDRQWHEVARMGITPRTYAAKDLFMLGAEENA